MRPRLAALQARLRDGVAADRDRLVLWLPVWLGIGILVYFALSREPPLGVGIALAAGSALLLALARRSRIAHAAAASLLALSIGFLAAELATRRMPPMPALPRHAALAVGRVAAVDLMADGRRRVTLEAVSIGTARAKGDEAGPIEDLAATARDLRIRLRADDPTVLSPGDRVQVRAMLHAPAPPDYPGGRDPERDAFFSGLAGSGTALAPVALLSHGPAVGAAGSMRRLRETIAARIQAVLPGPRGAIAATLLTGLSSAIPQVDRDAFAASGLAHLLAVAGLHLGIVMGLTLAIVRMGLAAWEWGALRLPGRQIAALAALAAGCLYMLLTGLHLPGLRSLAMATVAMLGLVIGRRTVSMRALAFAAILLLLINPATLLDVAYQMSFAAVLALLAGYEAARPMMRRLHGDGVRHRVAMHAFQLFFTSLLAGTASLPYAAFHFGRVQFYFVLANLVAVPLTAFWVMPQGLLSLMLMPFGLEAVTLRPMGAGIDLILFLARWVAAFPDASLPVPVPPSWGLLAVSLGLLWLCLWRRRWRALAVLPLAIGFASPWLIAAPDLLVSGDGRMIALHAGRSMLVEQASWADPITLSDWQRAWAVTATPIALPDAGTLSAGPVAASDDIVCNPAACLLTRRHQTVLLLRDPAAPGADAADRRDARPAIEPEDCVGVALLVSSSPSHGVCPGLPRIDRFTVWREGPQAVWLGPSGLTLESAHALQGSRPWVPSQPGSRRPTLPMAIAE